MERWAIYGKAGKKWIPLFKNGKTFKNKSYATKIMRHQNEFSRLTNRRLDLKVKAVIAHNCPSCGSKLIEG